MNEQAIISSFNEWMCIWVIVAIYIWILQDLSYDMKRWERDNFDIDHWEEAEDFVESELNLLGIKTVSDLEDNKDDE